MQKIIYVDDYMNFNSINTMLENGWTVHSITAQHIATGSTMGRKGGMVVVLIKTLKI